MCCQKTSHAVGPVERDTVRLADCSSPQEAQLKWVTMRDRVATAEVVSNKRTVAAVSSQVLLVVAFWYAFSGVANVLLHVIAGVLAVAQSLILLFTLFMLPRRAEAS
jgi:hypothetical protein